LWTLAADILKDMSGVPKTRTMEEETKHDQSGG